MNRLLPALLLLGLLGCHLERSCPSLALPGDEATSAPDTFPEDTPAGEDAATEEVAQIPAPLVLNEIRCTSGDWVELRNLGTAPLSDLGGWTLTDDPGNPDHVWSLPADLEIAGGARVVLLQADGDAPGFPFGLKCGEDTVTLLAPGGVEADAVALPVLAEGLTWGRIPDGTGAWAENVPTPAALNQGTAPPPTTDIADLIFDPFRVLPVEITLPPTSIDSLWAQPKEYVPATFRVASGHGMAPPRPIGIRIKGAWGSFRDLNGKTAFKVSFVFQDGEPWLGREHITLNNMVQDPSMLHEVVAYNLFRAMGIPCPRVGYAWVTVNGVPYGLYALLEPYDDVFLERVFPEGTGHLYENVYFVDVTPGNAPAFDVDEGDPEDLSDIEALIVANHHTPDAYWMETMAAFTHLPEMIRMWAVEQYIGHWDGYAPS
ncbi:MAG: CotH kinase family protein, partial [Deltaproteobacteria bacterium]|nr:CotH kinase family protein [Deltaproteobacteria bacterium]